jgi:hypothetical protein
MIDYTKEEWDSRKITYRGFSAALFDILLMGIYLIGGLGFIHASSDINSLYLTWGYLAAGIFFLFNAIGKLLQLFNPRDWYETEITMKKEEK